MRKWLIHARQQLNLTQQEVAEKANISKQMYYLIEHGLRCPSVHVAKRIAKVLNFDWTKFFE